MAEKKVSVIIDGKETVSNATESAGASLTVFGKKIPLVVDATKLLEGAWNMARNAIGSVSDRIMSAISAFDASEGSQRKLAGTAKILGVEQDYLNGIVNEGREKFQLSKGIATEYGIEIAKLAINSGNASSATELLGAFLDLGAAKGLTAEQSMQAVSQALLGIDEGTDKLFGKNPSGLWDDFSKVIGKSAGKFSDMDKAAALAYAALNDGNKVSGAFAEYLDTAAGKQDVLNQRMAEAEITFGKALQPVRMMALELGEKLMPVLGPLARVLGGVLGAVLIQTTMIFTDFWTVIVDVTGALAKLTGDKAVVDWAQRQSDAAKSFREKLVEAGKSVENVIKGIDDATKQSTAVAKTESKIRKDLSAELVNAAKARGDSETDAAKKAKAADKEMNEYIRDVKETYKLLREGMVTSTEAADRLGPAVKKSVDPAHVKSFNAAMEEIRVSTDLVMETMKQGGIVNVGTMDRLTSKINLANTSMVDVARGVLDAAQAFGVLDRDTASALNSVINIGTAIGKLATGDVVAGVSGLIGGVANIVSVMMQGDKERRELTRANTEALNKLRTDGVRLSNKASGDQIAGIAGALTPDQIGLFGRMTSELMRTQGNRLLTDLLAKQGLRLSDLDAVASELGFNLRRENGQVDLSQLPMFFAALQENMGALTRIGQTWQEQWNFLKESQRIQGTTGVGQIQGLVDSLKASGVGALGGLDLSDPVAARKLLMEMFVGLNNNTLGAGDLGRLTGEQFRDVLTELIGLLDGLKEDAPASGGPTGSAISGVPESVTAAGYTFTLAEIDATLKATSAEHSTILNAHTALHTQIAAATKGSWDELRVVNVQLRELIDVTTGNTDRMNQSLADARALALANAGQGARYG